MQTESLECQRPVDDAEKPVLMDVRGRLQTMLSALKAPQSTATCLLVAAKKYAAITTCLKTSRRPGARQLREFLNPLTATMGVCRMVIR